MAPPPREGAVVVRNVPWEKGEFHERTDADREHAIKEVVNILPVIDRLAVYFAVDAHVVMKKAVEPQIPEATLIDAELKLFLPASSQPLVCPASSDTTAPEVVKWDARSMGVN